MFKPTWVLLALWFGLSASFAAVDPTRPPNTRAGAGSAVSPQPARLQLQSIRISETGRWAVINGNRVREGERVQGARVVAIRAGQVELQRAGKRLRLNLASATKIKRYSQENK